MTTVLKDLVLFRDTQFRVVTEDQGEQILKIKTQLFQEKTLIAMEISSTRHLVGEVEEMELCREQMKAQHQKVISRLHKGYYSAENLHAEESPVAPSTPHEQEEFPLTLEEIPTLSLEGYHLDLYSTSKHNTPITLPLVDNVRAAEVELTSSEEVVDTDSSVQSFDEIRRRTRLHWLQQVVEGESSKAQGVLHELNVAFTEKQLEWCQKITSHLQVPQLANK